MKYLFVCTGNTCRSPMAEGIFNKIAKERGSEDEAGSAGIFASEGSEASRNSVDALRETGIDISGHKSRGITPDMLAEYDEILTMTKAHADALKSALPQFGYKIRTLSEAAGEDGEIPDPFGGDLEAYRACRGEIKRLIEKLWDNDK